MRVTIWGMASILLSALKEDRKRVLRRKMLCWQCKSHNWTSSLVRPSSNMFDLSQFQFSNFSHSTEVFVCSASIASASAPTVELCLWRVNLMLDMLPVETHPQGWIKISTKQIEYTNTKTASGKKPIQTGFDYLLNTKTLDCRLVSLCDASLIDGSS